MRYVIVDLEGSSRDYFSRREDLHEALLEIELEEPGTTAELFVIAYDDDGNQVGEPEGADAAIAPIIRGATTHGVVFDHLSVGSQVAVFSGCSVEYQDSLLLARRLTPASRA